MPRNSELALVRKNVAEGEIDKVEVFSSLTGVNFPGMILGYTLQLDFSTDQFTHRQDKYELDKRFPSPTCKIEFEISFNDILTFSGGLNKDINQFQYDRRQMKPIIFDPHNLTHLEVLDNFNWEAK